MKKIIFNIFFLLSFTIFFVSCSKGIKKDIKTKEIEENKYEEKKEEDRIKELYENKILKIAISTEPDSLDPFISASADTSSILKNIFDGLVKIRSCNKLDNDYEDRTIEKAIAENWDISEDGLKYTFTLKNDVKFHNGKYVKAEDVVYSYKKLSTLNPRFENIQDIKALDDYKVEITLKEPDYSFIYRVTEAVVPNNYEDSDKKPIGAGPYKFVSYEPTKKLVLEKFEDYYIKKEQKGHDDGNLCKPNIKNAEFLFIPDDNAKLLAFRSKNIDIFSASDDIVNQIKDNKESLTYKLLSNNTQLLALNNNKEPFNNKDVRKALNFAIDRDAIVKITTEGKGKKLFTIVSPINKNWYNSETEKVYNYNKEEAKKLLKSAGYENGFDMEIKVPSNYKIHVDTAQIIADQLSQVGIKVKIKQVEWATWLDEIYKNKDYQATIVGLVGKTDVHDSLIRFCSHYSKNIFNYNNEKYDEYIKKALLTPVFKERKEYYDKAQLLLTEDAVAVFLQDPCMNIVIADGIDGYSHYTVPFWDLSKFIYI